MLPEVTFFERTKKKGAEERQSGVHLTEDSKLFFFLSEITMFFFLKLKKVFETKIRESFFFCYLFIKSESRKKKEKQIKEKERKTKWYVHGVLI